LEAGGRYSYEKKKVADGLTVDTTAYSPTAPIGIPTPRRASASWDSFDPKVTLGYKPSDNFLAFITYSKGFKSGGFNLAGGAPAFDPEKITNIEGGIKFSSDDRRMSINLGVFHYKYADMQVQRIAADNLTFELVNAASATLQGLEVEFRMRPVQPLDLGVSVDYLDAAYDDFVTADPSGVVPGIRQLAGNRPPQAPEFRVRMDASYTWKLSDGDISLRGEGRWVDRTDFSPFNLDSLSVAAHADFNAFLTYDTHDWTIQAYVRNLTDKRWLSYVDATGGLPGFVAQSLVNDPRTFGVGVTRRW
jgi:iron complex outermembrane receptor protein